MAESLNKEELSAKAVLDKQPKVKINIPIDQLNPSDKVLPVCLNGVIYSIPKGKTVEVPQSVAEVYFYSQEKTAKANQDMQEKLNSEIVTL